MDLRTVLLSCLRSCGEINNNSPPSETRGLPRPDPRPELDTPTYQILENTLTLSQLLVRGGIVLLNNS